MASFGNMRDAYSSIYTKSPDTSITEALTLLQQRGIITEDEFETLMTREETDLEKMNRQLKVSNDKNGKTKKPKSLSSSESAQKASNFAANRNNNVGQMDHSKRND